MTGRTLVLAALVVAGAGYALRTRRELAPPAPTEPSPLPRITLPEPRRAVGPVIDVSTIERMRDHLRAAARLPGGPQIRP